MVGRTLMNLGNYQEAYDALLAAWNQWKGVLGASHTYALMTLADLAQTARQLGHDQTLPLYQALVEARTQQLGRGHADTLSAMNTMADILLQKKEPMALEVLRDISETTDQKHGPNQEASLTAIYRLAMAQRELEPNAAPDTFRDILKRYKARDIADMRMVQAYNDLAYTLIETSNPTNWQEAESHAQAALDVLDHLKTDPLHKLATAHVMDTMAFSLEKQGRNQEAIEYYLNAAKLGHETAQAAADRLKAQQE